MNWDKYLKANETELELIQFVSIFYLLNVFMYTVDDFRNNYPTYLILMGLFFHGLIGVLLIDHDKKYKIWGLRRLVERLLPFGLLATYFASFYVAQQRKNDIGGLPIFLVPTIPVILYTLLVGYNVRLFVFLKDKRWIYNYGFIALYAIAYAWVKFSK